MNEQQIILYYSEGSGTSCYEVGQFKTIEDVQRHMMEWNNYHAVWTIECKFMTFKVQAHELIVNDTPEGD